MQADPEWCGGVSELVKICTLGSAYDAHVIPHGHNVHAAMHVVASQSPMTCPLVEFLILKMESYYFFDKPGDGENVIMADGSTSFSPEYESCRQIAEEKDVALKDVYEEARRAYCD